MDELHDPNFEFEPDEWHCEIGLGINEVRMMYDILDYFIETWPGSPRRPANEQMFAQFMKRQMFAMKMQHQLDKDL